MAYFKMSGGRMKVVVTGNGDNRRNNGPHVPSMVKVKAPFHVYKSDPIINKKPKRLENSQLLKRGSKVNFLVFYSGGHP